jgi:hypothetical protein
VALFCQEHPNAHSDPHVSIAAFPRDLLDERASWGLKHAFEEFRGAYYMQRRALGDLRFWRLLERASTLTGRRARPNVTIEMLFDADKRALFLASCEEEGEAEPFASLDDALVAVGAECSENLAVATLGILFFRLVGAGRWRAEPEAHDSVFGLYVAVAERHKRKIGDRLGLLANIGAWAITTHPLALEVIKDALKKAKLLFPKHERIVRPCLSGGARSNGVWLGRPRFLPTLESDTVNYVIRNALPHATKTLLSIEQGQLKSDQSVDGAFFIHPSLLRGEEHAPWSIRLQFVSNAFVHSSLASARRNLPLLRDWDPGVSARLEIATQEMLTWESGESACADVLEAVYTCGRSGWEEAQIIALLERADDAMNPWRLLHSLRDAGIVEPRLRAGWKGRVWTLQEPRIIEAHRLGQPLVQVEGALCSRMIEDFKLAVEGLGGTPFRRLGVTQWAPPMFGALDVPAKVLAERLGWRFVTEPKAPIEKPLAFIETQHQALHYEPRDAWSWSVRRFLSGEGAQEGVQLVRLTHTGERDHDVYRVEHKGRKLHYLSRIAAIASAHALARTPLFEWCPEEGVIALRGREGGLPDALATEMRRRMLRNAGPRGSEYVYPANDAVARWLDAQLSGCISGVFHGAQDTRTLISLARRSLGRSRLQWRNGSITL